MKSHNVNFAKLADSYVSALAGSQIVDALQYHASMANVNLKFTSWEGSNLAITERVFRAADGQKKLQALIEIIRNDGFLLDAFEIREETSINDLVSSFDETKYRGRLKSETEYVDIRGIGRRQADDALVFPILELYTELFVQAGLSNLDLDKGRMRGSQRIALTEMVKLTRCLLIMGDPGSGKTTFLRFLARKSAENVISKDLPIFLRLADIYDYAKNHDLPMDENAITEFFVNTNARNGNIIKVEEFESLAKEGRWLFLFDSLDELSSTVAREEIVKAVEVASKKWDACKFVVTSRPLPVEAKSIPIGFERVGIDNWSKDDIKSFLQAWTKLLFPKASDEMHKRHWGNLLATILNRPDLRTLAKNAVMVTAMAVVHQNEAKLPEGRADLLEALIYWLIRAKTRPDNLPYTEYNFIEGRYKELALAMVEAEGGRRRRVGRLWASQQISRYFDGQTNSALDFLNREETDTGVLVRRGEGDLEFWHLSFQEYLAAEEIAGKTDHPDKGWWSKIENYLDEPEWREVIIFIPLCLNRLGSDRVDLFFERLAESCQDGDLQTKAKRVALGGTIIRDLRLTGYKPVNVPQWTKILNDVTLLFGPQGSDVPLETRYEAAVAYGSGGDSRLRNFEETWIPVSGGNFLFGAQSKDKNGINFDIDAAPWESPVIPTKINDFEIRKYPITVQEFNEFILDDGYKTESYWGEEGWKWVTENGETAPLDWEEQLLAPNTPVTGVSWLEACAYSEWLTQNDIRNIEYRLPTESEWEYAAKRYLKKGQRFPWGNQVTPGDNCEANFAWTGLRKKSPVGIFYKCATEDGIIDLFGNVEEWCADNWSPDHTASPNDGSAVRNNSEDCVVKGGSTIRFSRLCRATYRSRITKSKQYHPVGFRIIRYLKNPDDFQKNKITSIKSNSHSDQSFAFTEDIDYFKLGKESLWGPGEDETLIAIKAKVHNGLWLDLGAGDGRYSIPMLKLAENLVAADLDEKALKKLDYRSPRKLRKKLHLVKLNITSLSFKKESFDGILCTGLLHLFPEDMLFSILTTLSNILKPEGTLILDFGTDIERRFSDGSIYKPADEMVYTTSKALKLLEMGLPGVGYQIQLSSFEDDLTKTGEYEYNTRGKFILLVGKKK